MDKKEEAQKESKITKLLDNIGKNLDGEEQEAFTSLRSSNFARYTCVEKLRYLISNITVEPVLFLTDLAGEITGATPEYLLLEKICHVELNNSLEKCHSTLYNNSNSDLLKEIHNSMAYWSIITSLMQGIPAIIVTLIMVSWSDKHGRKFPIIAPMFVQILGLVLLILNAHFFNAPVYFLIISKIPTALFGTFFVFPIILAYLAEVSSTEYRAIRFMALSIVAETGFISGSFIGGQIYKAAGYYAVFATSIGMYLLAVIYSLIFLKETERHVKQQEENPASKMARFKDIFTTDTLIGSLRTVFKARPNGARLYLSLFLIIEMIFALSGGGLSEVSFLFQQLIFNWDATETANYNGIISIVRALVSLASFIILILILRGKDEITGIIGTLASMIGLSIIAFSKQEWIYYFGRFIQAWETYSGPALLSIISQIIPGDEIGKVIGVVESFIRIFELGTAPSYQAIYKVSLDFFPGLVFVVTAILMLIPLVYYIHLKSSNVLEKVRIKKISMLNIETEVKVESDSRNTAPDQMEEIRV